MDHTHTNSDVVRRLGCEYTYTDVFYIRVSNFLECQNHLYASFSDHKKSADALRSYAEKYHKQAVREAA